MQINSDTSNFVLRKPMTSLGFSSSKTFKNNDMIESSNYHNKQENISEGQIMNSSCGCGANILHKSKDQQETKYQCPMNCEGNKTYNQPGKCPVCDMQLVVVGIDEPRIHVE